MLFCSYSQIFNAARSCFASEQEKTNILAELREVYGENWTSPFYILHGCFPEYQCHFHVLRVSQEQYTIYCLNSWFINDLKHV